MAYCWPINEGQDLQSFSFPLFHESGLPVTTLPATPVYIDLSVIEDPVSKVPGMMKTKEDDISNLEKKNKEAQE